MPRLTGAVRPPNGSGVDLESRCLLYSYDPTLNPNVLSARNKTIHNIATGIGIHAPGVQLVPDTWVSRPEYVP